MEQKPPVHPNAPQTQQPASTIVVRGRERPFHERLISGAAMIGGGLLGGKLGMDWLDGAPENNVDVTKMASWEHEEQALAQAKKAAKNSGELGKETNKVLEKLGISVPDNKNLIADEIEQNLADQQQAHLEKNGKNHPKIISARTAQRLQHLNVTDIESLRVTRDAEGALSGILTTVEGDQHRLPKIGKTPFDPKLKHLARGKSVTLVEESLHTLGLPGGIIDDVMTSRRKALLKDVPNANIAKNSKQYFKAFQAMDGMNKFNVASMAVVGVIIGSYAASGINSLLRGGSHAASVVAGREEQNRNSESQR